MTRHAGDPRVTKPGKGYIPLQSKWKRDTLVFEVARLIRNKTKPEDGVTIQWLTEVIWGQTFDPMLLATRCNNIQKAISKIRADDPTGQIILVYAFQESDPITKRKQIKYYNHINLPQLEPVHNRMLGIADGIVRRVERNEELVTIKWETRKKEIEKAMAEQARELTEIEDMLKTQKHTLTIDAMGHSKEQPPRGELHPECHICNQQIAAHKWTSHMNQHKRERIDDLNTLAGTDNKA